MAATLTTIQLTAPDISCEHCERAITEAVGALDGVETVAVDIPTKVVTITFDPAAVQTDAIEAAMDDEGYPVTK